MGIVGFSSLSGGIGAELTGGDFWQGAANGAIIGLLNAGHEQLQKQLDKFLNMASTAGTAAIDIRDEDYEKLIIDMAASAANSKLGLGWQFDAALYFYQKTGLMLRPR